MQWTIEHLAVGECDMDWVPMTGLEIAGDFVVISPTSAWPRDLVYSVNGTSSESDFKIQACNRPKKDEAGGPIPGATYLFNYAVLGY